MELKGYKDITCEVKTSVHYIYVKGKTSHQKLNGYWVMSSLRENSDDTQQSHQLIKNTLKHACIIKISPQ